MLPVSGIDENEKLRFVRDFYVDNICSSSYLNQFLISDVNQRLCSLDVAACKT